MLALGLITFCGWGALLVFLDRYGQRDRALGARGDCIIVLGAHVLPNGEMGPSLAARAAHAAALYRRGAAKKIICTGGLGTHAPEESVAAAKYLRNSGVLSSDIFLEKTSTSTWGNLSNAAPICRARGWKRVILVSEPFHLWRAERNCRALGLTPIVSPSGNRSFASRARMTVRESFAVLRDLTAGNR